MDKRNSLSIKFIAIILMVIYHTFSFPNRISAVNYDTLMSIKGVPIERIVGSIGDICVFIFIFLSGYGMFTKWEKFQGGVKGLFKGAITTVIKFYINIWVVFIIFIPLGIMMGKYKFSLIEIVLNVTGISSSFNGEWWFIKLYVMLIMTFPIMKILVDKGNDKLIMGLSFLLMITGNIIAGHNNLILGILCMLFTNQIYFIIGMLSAKHKLFELIKIKSKIVTIGLFIAIIATCVLLKKYYMYKYILVAIVPLFICIINNMNINNKVAITIGKHSNNIWLIHTFFCYYLFQQITFSFKYSILILLFIFVANISISMGIRRITDEITIFCKEIFIGKTKINDSEFNI